MAMMKNKELIFIKAPQIKFWFGSMGADGYMVTKELRGG